MRVLCCSSLSSNSISFNISISSGSINIGVYQGNRTGSRIATATEESRAREKITIPYDENIVKTIEELLEMSSNDLLKYCESLKYFTIDKDDFNILKTSNIVITNIIYDKVHKQFDLSYHFKDSSIYDDDIKRPIYWLSLNTCGDYCGLFESRQDAINAAKQYAKKEILEQINVLIDGPFIQEQRDITLAMRGSSNQRIIDLRVDKK